MCISNNEFTGLICEGIFTIPTHAPRTSGGKQERMINLGNPLFSRTMQYRWTLGEQAQPEAVQSLARDLSGKHPFPESLAAVMIQRGIADYESAKDFFRPTLDDLHDPYLLVGMDVAVARFCQAVDRGEKILFYGDYDVDGTTAVTMMCLFAEDWGIDYDFYIPDRYREGYGLSHQGIDEAVAGGADLMVTLDCGIKAVEQIRYANQQGLETIICDHHRPGIQLPEAVAILDPLIEPCYPCTSLTGCGVALKLLQALSVELTERGYQPARDKPDPVSKYCDLVTLSIACDIVQITGENRILAHHGLQKLRNNPTPGLKALMDQSTTERSWDISDLVFFIGPRINSAGRLTHAREAVHVLMGNSERLDELAKDLEQANDERKLLDQEMTGEALQMIQENPAHASMVSNVLLNETWHKGVIGIVASRVIEHHYRPTILLTENEGRLVGSARSVSGFDLYAALEASSEHVLQFGGHTFAAGLTMKKEAFPAFCKKFDQVVRERITEDQKMPELRLDREIHFHEVDARLIRILGQMEPFGPGNRRPVFLTRNAKVLHHTILKDIHVKLVVEQNGRMFEAIGFGLASSWQSHQATQVDLAYQPVFNIWRKEVTINLRLKDILPTHQSNVKT